MASDVFFTNMRTGFNNSLLDKLRRVMKAAGFDSIDFQDHASVLDGFRRIITVLSESKDPQHQDEYIGSLTPEEAQLEYGYSQVLNSLQGMMMYLRDEL